MTYCPSTLWTRIAAGFMIDLLGRGWTPEEILREYYDLIPETIRHISARPPEYRQSGLCVLV
jgi:hypothetical protein